MLDLVKLKMSAVKLICLSAPSPSLHTYAICAFEFDICQRILYDNPRNVRLSISFNHKFFNIRRNCYFGPVLLPTAS